MPITLVVSVKSGGADTRFKIKKGGDERVYNVVGSSASPTTAEIEVGVGETLELEVEEISQVVYAEDAMTAVRRKEEPVVKEVAAKTESAPKASARK